MVKFTQMAKRFCQDDSGATAIEYGIIAALIALVIVGAVSVIGVGLSNKFNFVATNLQ